MPYFIALRIRAVVSRTIHWPWVAVRLNLRRCTTNSVTLEPGYQLSDSPHLRPWAWDYVGGSSYTHSRSQHVGQYPTSTVLYLPDQCIMAAYLTVLSDLIPRPSDKLKKAVCGVGYIISGDYTILTSLFHLYHISNYIQKRVKMSGRKDVHYTQVSRSVRKADAWEAHCGNLDCYKSARLSGRYCNYRQAPWDLIPRSRAWMISKTDRDGRCVSEFTISYPCIPFPKRRSGQRSQSTAGNNQLQYWCCSLN